MCANSANNFFQRWNVWNLNTFRFRTLTSKHLKSEQVRILDSSLLFGSNFCSVSNLSEIWTDLFQTEQICSDFRHCNKTQAVWNPHKNWNPNVRFVLFGPNYLKSERLKTEHYSLVSNIQNLNASIPNKHLFGFRRWLKSEHTDFGRWL